MLSWRFEEANNVYEEAIKLNFENTYIYFYKWKALEKLWKPEEADHMFNKSTKLAPENAEAYYARWIVFQELWKLKEAIYMFNKITKLAPENAEAYFCKWEILGKLWKTKSLSLYYFTTDILKWEDPCYNTPYKTEEQEIYKFIKEQNFELLRKYLLELEKTETVKKTV
jgi:tetratricopeptide (TPR) repeat protein